MRLWKILVAFMIAMTVTLVGSVYVSFQLASTAFEQVSVQGRDKIIEQAAAALAHGGERELKNWLNNNPRPAPGTALVTVTRYTAEGSAEIAGDSTDLVLARQDGHLHVFQRDPADRSRLLPSPPNGKNVRDTLADLLS